MENKPTLVVALGGNALLKRGEPLEADIQRKNIELAAKTIAQLTQQWRVILVHGNGPQVGLLALQNSAYDRVTPYPLDILGAESQGMIGYMLQQALKNQPSVIRPNISDRFTTTIRLKRYTRKRAGFSKPMVKRSVALCPLHNPNVSLKVMLFAH